MLCCAEVYHINKDGDELEESIEIFHSLFEKEITQFNLYKSMHMAGFSEDDISRVWNIYQSEEPISPKHISIKEDLELFSQIKNIDRLIGSLKRSKILEYSRQKAHPLTLFNHFPMSNTNSKPYKELTMPLTISNQGSFNTFAERKS